MLAFFDGSGCAKHKMKRHLQVALVIVCGSLSLSCSETSDSVARIADLEQAINDGAFGNIHSVIASIDGERRIEWYFSGTDQRSGVPVGMVEFDSTTLHDLRSLTKSVVSLVVGIALSEGAIGSIDDSVVDYLPEYSDLFTPAIERIRLRHLLSMTSGLGWDERTYPYSDPRNSETALDAAQDRIRYVLSLPVIQAPGDRFVYSSGDVDLLAQIVARATGVPLDAYAQKALFTPLGITEFEWAEYESGGVIASWGLRLRPRDTERIGRLVLQMGMWDGQEVVSKTWIRELMSPRVAIDVRSGVGYGNYWWFRRIGEGDDAVDFMQAEGNGGQRIAIFGEQRLIVTTTAGFYGEDDGQSNAVVRAVYAALRDE